MKTGLGNCVVFQWYYGKIQFYFTIEKYDLTGQYTSSHGKFECIGSEVDNFNPEYKTQTLEVIVIFNYGMMGPHVKKPIAFCVILDKYWEMIVHRKREH